MVPASAQPSQWVVTGQLVLEKSKAAVRKLARGLTREIEPSSASSLEALVEIGEGGFSSAPSTSFFHRVRSSVRISNP
jgi:hypothetical protein